MLGAAAMIGIRSGIGPGKRIEWMEAIGNKCEWRSDGKFPSEGENVCGERGLAWRVERVQKEAGKEQHSADNHREQSKRPHCETVW